MRRWWRGTSLVAERSLVENLRSRSFKFVTGLLLLLSVVGVVAPQVFDDANPTYTLATVGKAPPELVAALDGAGERADFAVTYVERADAGAVESAVRDGDATTGLADDKLYGSATAGSFPLVVTQVLVSLEISRQLTAAGLEPAQIARIQQVRPPEQVTIGPAQDESRAGVGFAVGIVLYIALVFAGNAIATNVAVEKSTRISEVLLAVVRPSQVLVGTVLAVGTATLIQLLVLAAPLGVAVRVTDTIGLPAVAAGDIALAVVWFVLGFALYAFLFAAAAALVNKVTEVSSAITPIIIVLVGGYLLGVTVVTADPGSGWSVAASLFPLTAPLSMPIRWASGAVPVYQLTLAMLLTAAAAVLMVLFASAIYRRALVITGRRVRLREVIGRHTPS